MNIPARVSSCVVDYEPLMRILAFDTSSNACSVALKIDSDITFQHDMAPMQQARLLLPTIHQCLQIKNIKLNQLDAIAFGRGPGSFTGVRIATSVAQALGFATGIPLLPISSLAGLAQAAYHDLGQTSFCTAVDARIQEVYWAIYTVDSNGYVNLQGQERVTPPQELCLPDTFHGMGVGNAWEIYQNHIYYQPLHVDPTRCPSALGIVQLAEKHYANKEWIHINDALPVYLRNNVAHR